MGSGSAWRLETSSRQIPEGFRAQGHNIPNTGTSESFKNNATSSRTIPFCPSGNQVPWGSFWANLSANKIWKNWGWLSQGSRKNYQTPHPFLHMILWNIYTPQKSNIDTKKWPYFKGVHLFQTIILGIHVSFPGCIYIFYSHCHLLGSVNVNANSCTFTTGAIENPKRAKQTKPWSFG